jgi:cellulose synthase/poly-beta-1,6-N-acetylglucosamine synthase-like glycosyltransferase
MSSARAIKRRTKRKTSMAAAQLPPAPGFFERNLDKPFFKTFTPYHILTQDLKLMTANYRPQLPSIQQIGYWCATGAGIGSLYFIEQQYDVISSAFLYQGPILLGCVYSWDQFFNLMNLSISKYPKASPLDKVDPTPPEEASVPEMAEEAKSPVTVRNLEAHAIQANADYSRMRFADFEEHDQNHIGPLSPAQLNRRRKFAYSTNANPMSVSRYWDNRENDLLPQGLGMASPRSADKLNGANALAEHKEARHESRESSVQHVTFHLDETSELAQTPAVITAALPSSTVEEKQSQELRIDIDSDNNEKYLHASISPPLSYYADEDQDVVPEAILREWAKNAKVAYIIPCHLSLLNIEATLAAALKHVPPENIIVMDNGNADTPSDNLQDLVRLINPRITYMWTHIGNKNLVEKIGAELALEKGLIYCVTSDDDTMTPASIHLSDATDKIDLGDFRGAVKAVGYPLIAVSAADYQDDDNQFIKCQHIEYSLAGLSKLAQDRLGGALYPHGGACVFHTETLIKVMKIHSLRFYSEDTQKGFRLADLGYKLGFAAEVPYKTKAPATVFGGFPNYYQQQVRSWVMSPPTLLYEYTKSLIFHNNYSWSALPFIKLYQLNNIYTVLVPPISIALMCVKGNDPRFWYLTAPWLLTPALAPMILKWRLEHNDRKDLSFSYKDCLWMIPYRMLGTIMTALGAARACLVYLPTRQHILTADEVEAGLRGDRKKLAEDIAKQPKNLFTYKKYFAGRLFKEDAELANARANQNNGNDTAMINRPAS